MHHRSRNNLHNVIALLLYAVFSGLCFGFSACTASALQVQARTADSIARAMNTALPVLVESEEQQGNVAIDNAHSETEARAAIAHVEAQWSGFWSAWGAARTAQDQWAVLILQAQAGRAFSMVDAVRVLGAFRSAWCDLRHTIPPPNTLPDLPLVPCTAGAGVAPGDASHE